MTNLKRLATASAPIARDLVGLAGLGLLVAGVAAISHAIAMIVAGAVMVGGAVLWARRA